MSLTERFFGSPGGPPDPDTVNLSVSLDNAFGMLKEERRRWTLRFVNDTPGGEVNMGTLALELTAHELDIHPHIVSSNQRKSRYVGLYQSHLPKLDEVGLIEFDSDRGLIRVTPETDQAVAFLDVATSMLEGRE